MQHDHPELQSSLGARHALLGLGLIFVVTLAVVVAKQMSTEAMAVVIGIICGVAASIPTTLLLTLVLTRRDRQKDDDLSRTSRPGAYPPVVVIQGGAPQGMPMLPQAGYWPAPQAGPTPNRQFNLVGQDGFYVDGE